MSGEGNADDANAALGGGGGPVDRVSDITSTLTPSGPCVMPPRVRTKGRYAQSVKVHMLNGGKTPTALQGQSQARVGCAARSRQGSLEWVSEQRAHSIGLAAAAVIKSTAVRGYAETVSPRLPRHSGGIRADRHNGPSDDQTAQ